MPLLLPPGPQWHSLKKTVKAVYSVQWNLSFRTPLIKGHLHSGTQNFVQEKCSGTPLFTGKGPFFWVLF